MEGTAAAWGSARRAASQRRPKCGSRRRLERFLGDTLIRVALVVFVLWTLAPVAWMVVSSLLNQTALTSVPPDLSASQFTLDNYRGVLATGGSLVPAFRNSLIVSFLTTGIALTLGSAAAYAIARLGVPGGDRIALLALATQMFPGIVIIIPLFIVLSRLGLIDTYAGLVVVYLSFVLPIVIWVLKGFFESIPPELEKAAAIDGATTSVAPRIFIWAASRSMSPSRPGSSAVPVRRPTWALVQERPAASKAARSCCGVRPM